MTRDGFAAPLGHRLNEQRECAGVKGFEWHVPGEDHAHAPAVRRAFRRLWADDAQARWWGQW